MKKLVFILTIITIVGTINVSISQVINVCGTDTVILNVSNYQYGTIQWEESYDNLNWSIIQGANDSFYKFFPNETKYHRAVVKFSECPPEYSEISLVQLPPVASAGSNRIVPDNNVSLMANIESGALGTWSIIDDSSGSFTNINDPYSDFQGSDSSYTLVWSLSNTCGTSTDTIEIQFRQNIYVDYIAIVDSTDQIISDSAQMAQGLYIIKFSDPVPEIEDSTVLIGLVNDGFLRIVESYTFNLDTFTMYTRQGTLEDITVFGAFDLAAPFHIDSNLSRSNSTNYQRLDHMPTRAELTTNPEYKKGNYYYVVKNTPVYTYPGVTLENRNYRSGGSLINLTFKGALFTTANSSLELNGYYKFNPNLVAELDHSGLNLHSFKLGMYNGTIERNYKLLLTASSSTNLIDFPFTLLSVKKNIVFVIAGVPVWIQAQFNVDGNVSADISGSMNISHEYTKTSTYTAALEFKYGDWLYPFEKKHEVNTVNSFSVTGDLTQAFDVGPNITFKIFGIVGPYIHTRLTEDFNLCLYNSSWQANLNIGGELTIGAKAEGMGFTLFDIDKTWSQGFYKLQFPNRLEMLSGNNQKYDLGNSLTKSVKIKVMSNKGFAVPLVVVKFQPKDGGSTQKNYVITNTAGEAETIWTPGGSKESELEVSVFDCDGNDINNSPIIFKAYANSSSTNCSHSSLSASVIKIGNTIKPKGHMGKPPYTYSTNGSGYSSQVPIITLSAGITYNFYIKDDAGCIATVSYTSTNNPCNNSSLSVNALVTANLITASAQNGNPPYLYSLDNASGGFSSNNIFQNVTTGNHIVYVKDNTGCTNSKSVYVSSNFPPIIANFVADKTYINPGNTIQFQNLSNNGTSWLWDFGNGNTSTQKNPSNTYSTVGIYTISLKATNNYGSNTKTKIDYITVFSPAVLSWKEDFESYTINSFPSTWVKDANASAGGNYIDSNGYESDQCLKLLGKINGCWGAIAYHNVNATKPFEIEIAIKNGNETLGGCHPDRGYLGLRKGTSWSNPARELIKFMGNGDIKSGGGNTLGTYSTLTWYHLRVRYERVNSTNISLSYWINNDFKGTEILPSISSEEDLDNIDITIQEGSAWFDEIKVYQY